MRSIINALIASFLYLTPSNVCAQEKIYAIHHVDCAAMMVRDQIVKDEYLINEPDLTIKLVTFEGFVLPVPQNNTIYIPQKELEQHFKNGVPVEYYRTLSTIFGNKIDDYKNFEFIVTQRINDEEIITFFKIINNCMIGFPHKSTRICCGGDRNVKSILTDVLKEAKEKNKTMIWYGDNLQNVNISKLADDENYKIYRRSVHVGNSIIPNILDKKFEPSKSTICNAIPSTTDQLNQAGFSTLSTDKWKAFYDKIDDMTKSAFSSKILTIDDLKKELISGDQDMLLIVAHSDGIYLHINNERININDVNSWEDRVNKIDRTAILMVCDAGNQDMIRGWWLWRERIEPLSDLLIKKGYFSKVIAPDHEIKSDEVIPVISMLLENKTLLEIRQTFSGWMEYVFKYFRKSHITNITRNEK